MLRTKELEKQIEDQKKLVEEMRRKSEQGSMQLQGEVQELMLEEMLQSTFPFDKIEEVGKGVRGADCIQIVRNQFGNESGKIIYESKRTKDFSNEWIEKLKKICAAMERMLQLLLHKLSQKTWKDLVKKMAYIFALLMKLEVWLYYFEMHY